jgi:hypothetical protein
MTMAGMQSPEPIEPLKDTILLKTERMRGVTESQS